MLTFKQFVAENALDDLQLELYLRRRFRLSKEDSILAAEFVYGATDILDHPKLWAAVHAGFSQTMPYDVAKAEAPDFEPEEWVRQTLLHDLKKAGITAPEPDSPHPPRDASDPMPARR